MDQAISAQHNLSSAHTDGRHAHGDYSNHFRSSVCRLPHGGGASQACGMVVSIPIPFWDGWKIDFLYPPGSSTLQKHVKA